MFEFEFELGGGCTEAEVGVGSSGVGKAVSPLLAGGGIQCGL